MKNKIALLILLALLPLVAGSKPNDCPIMKLNVERLPDLNCSRAGHLTFIVNGELTVVGGHTTGFIPTATAEYFSKNEWHLLPTVYSHDDGFGVVMRSGMVLIAGGHSENLGVGQTFEVEKYEPLSHQFTGFGCLDRRRTLSRAIELSNGNVVVSGNHFNTDGVALYDGSPQFVDVKESSQQRALPYVLRISGDDVLIFGPKGQRMEDIDTILVDRLKGEPLRVALFDEWRPIVFDRPLDCSAAFTGNEAKGYYSYLVPVMNRGGDMAIMEVRDTLFSLLPTTTAIPQTMLGDTIVYDSPFVVDCKAGRAYITAHDKSQRRYVLAVDYTKHPAPITFYYTDAISEMGNTIPVLTDNGNLIIAGGIDAFKGSNYTPLSSVWLLRVGGSAPDSITSTDTRWWLWLLLVLALIVAGAIGWLIARRTQKKEETVSNESGEELMEKICTLVESNRLYLNNNLQVMNVAKLLGVHRNTISECVNTYEGCSFNLFINRMRIEYAKEQMIKNKHEKLSHISDKSGFTSESTFFRAFKRVTGVTPKEWMQQNEGTAK